MGWLSIVASCLLRDVLMLANPFCSHLINFPFTLTVNELLEKVNAFAYIKSFEYLPAPTILNEVTLEMTVNRLFLVVAFATLLSSSLASSFATPPTQPSIASHAARTQHTGSPQLGVHEDIEAGAAAAPVEITDSTVDSNSLSRLIAPPEDTSAKFMGPNASPPGLLRRKLPSFPWHQLPNFITYTRCLAIPGLVGLFYVPGKHVETGSLFAAAAFTDWLDGFLARKWDISSSFGAFLDPVADKLMVSTSLILLSGRYGSRVAIPTAIILAREISVSALREWMAQRGQRDLVKVGFQGKLKTAVTMATLTLLMLIPFGEEVGILGKEVVLKAAFSFLYFCAGITITSGSVYFRAAIPVLLKANSK